MFESRNDGILFQPLHAISLYQLATRVLHVADCVIYNMRQCQVAYQHIQVAR